MSPLDRAFYDRPVLEVAEDLVGCTLRCGETAGVIVETEAYHFSEAACHAYVGVTPRTEVIWGPPGIAYVYRSYGIHALFNAVCEPDGVGAAVLVRALEPTDGIEVMRMRRGVSKPRPGRGLPGSVPDTQLCNGPGKLTQALGILLTHNRADLVAPGGPIAIEPRGGDWAQVDVVRSAPRIGITKAVDLDWRFTARGHRGVSRPHPAAGSKPLAG